MPGNHRVPASIRTIARDIAEIARGRTFTLMEVCGTHTVSILRSGIRSLLPSTLRLVSGPGCPVCVTPVSYIDRLIAYARMPKTVIATFGDLVRVPGSRSSLRREKSRGADVRLIYSPLESLALAGSEPRRKVILAAVGFETTTPAVAAAAIEARARRLNNFFILSGGRMIPPAMDALLKGGSKIDGFLCPGHVSVVIGTRPYERIARIYKVPCVIAGFEPLDILLAVRELAEMIAAGKSGVKNLYPRAVEPGGNPKARRATETVFRAKDAEWRGLGVIPRSGYFLRKEFQDFDAGRMLPVSVQPAGDNPRCRCGDVLTGTIEPPECPAFARRCSPDHPLGPCMVSSEGTCAAWFAYRIRGRC